MMFFEGWWRIVQSCLCYSSKAVYYHLFILVAKYLFEVECLWRQFNWISRIQFRRYRIWTDRDASNFYIFIFFNFLDGYVHFCTSRTNRTKFSKISRGVDGRFWRFPPGGLIPAYSRFNIIGSYTIMEKNKLWRCRTTTHGLCPNIHSKIPRLCSTTMQEICSHRSFTDVLCTFL